MIFSIARKPYHIANARIMKNEPIVTYNHMEEDDARNPGSPSVTAHPISLYMILVVDVILIAAVIYMAFQAIF